MFDVRPGGGLGFPKRLLQGSSEFGPMRLHRTRDLLHPVVTVGFIDSLFDLTHVRESSARILRHL
jgi:hypothetical protein